MHKYTNLKVVVIVVVVVANTGDCYNDIND